MWNHKFLICGFQKNQKQTNKQKNRHGKTCIHTHTKKTEVFSHLPRLKSNSGLFCYLSQFVCTDENMGITLIPAGGPDLHPEHAGDIMSLSGLGTCWFPPDELEEVVGERKLCPSDPVPNMLYKMDGWIKEGTNSARFE